MIPYPKNYFNIYFAGIEDAAKIEKSGRITNNGFSTELNKKVKQ